MGLNTRQKEEVRQVGWKWFYRLDENGNPVGVKKGEENFSISLKQLKEKAINELEEKGYTCYLAKPNAANCIIRVYHDEKEYDGDTYRFFGVYCFTKAQNGRWTCGCEGSSFEIDFTKLEKRIWFFQDEYWDVSLDFFDVYVKLVKEK